MGADEKNKEEKKEITIKFGKGNVQKFTGKDGTEYAKIVFRDGEEWKSFVMPAKYVHENQYGKGMWCKLLAEGHTKVSTNVKGEDGNYLSSTVANKDLKAIVESYKKKQKKSR